MDIKLQDTLFIGVPSSKDLGDKLMLFCLLIQIYHKIKEKKRTVTYEQVVKACMPPTVKDTKFIQTLADACHWLDYGCSKYPDMKLTDKEAIAKIQELVLQLIPF